MWGWMICRRLGKGGRILGGTRDKDGTCVKRGKSDAIAARVAEVGGGDGFELCVCEREEVWTGGVLVLLSRLLLVT